MTRIFDLVMTHKLDADDLFIHCVQQACAEARLNFFLIEPLWVEQFYDFLAKGRLWPRVLLNMHSEHHDPGDIYHRLLRMAAERNVKVIDHPDLALASFDKARIHPRLIGAGLHVPYTVVVPVDKTASFQLSEEELAALGSPFVIKPSMGYGRKGVIMDATSEKDIVRSVSAWPDGHYLLQRRIFPRDISGRPAYFRVYYVFGAIWCCWWNCFTDGYQPVTPQEGAEFNLKPLEEIIREIAAITQMNFFSSEIAQAETGEFVVIDYVNDQCHMLSQSAHPQIGVPDEVVRGIARRLVQASQELISRG